MTSLPDIPYVSQTSKIVLIFIIMCFILWSGLQVSKLYDQSNANSPWLIADTHNCKNSLKVPGHKIMNPINNTNGIEFTYACWLYIDDWDHGFGEWKHIFHKGNNIAMPLQSPGLWLMPKQNAMVFNINTFHSVKESVEIENVPLHKWVHYAFTLTNKYIDVYVNGHLKKRAQLVGIPRLNHGDIYITNWGGFSGFLSHFKYFNKAASIQEIETLVEQGPSDAPCASTGALAPLHDRFFTGNSITD
jgi:hypothetical protein